MAEDAGDEALRYRRAARRWGIWFGGLLLVSAATTGSLLTADVPGPSPVESSGPGPASPPRPDPPLSDPPPAPPQPPPEASPRPPEAPAQEAPAPLPRSTPAPEAGRGGPGRASLDLAALTALVTAFGTLATGMATVSNLVLAWRTERRQAREFDLKFRQLLHQVREQEAKGPGKDGAA